MAVRRRDVIGGLVACAGGVSRPGWAAPRIRALSLRQLVDASVVVADAVPERVESVWVEVFGARRIVTFWRLQLVDVIAGAAAAHAEVVTLGGSAEGTQQWVPHEAELRAGGRHLTFLREGPFDRLWVTGMLQGAFELALDAKGVRVAVSSTQSELAETAGSAVCALAHRGLDEAKHAILNEWKS